MPRRLKCKFCKYRTRGDPKIARAQLNAHIQKIHSSKERKMVRLLLLEEYAQKTKM